MSSENQIAAAAACCPACGAMLEAGRFDGLCPACAWAALMEPDQPVDITIPSEPSLLSIPGHQVLEEIARGGMGVVYRARQFEPDRIVALKMLLPHQSGLAEMRERFRLETRAIAALDHPAILPVYQVGYYECLPFFTMKYAPGGTLATRRHEYEGRFRPIADLIATLADAIQFAHEHGVLHRDLKPGNILFDEEGRPHVSDFGLAKFIGTDTGLTQSIHFLGTPHYSAPEVAARSARFATTASDIYSLGAILYVLLAGHPPFEAEGIPALLKKISDEEPPRLTRDSLSGVQRKRKPRNRVPRDLEVICLNCLAKEPAQRYASAEELGADLRRWLQGWPIQARPVSKSERLLKWARRNAAIAALAGLLLVAILGSAITLARSNQQLQKALMGSYAALHESLTIQARLERTSGRIGWRSQALALAEGAVALSPRPGVSTAAGPLAARNEIAAALALSDLRPIARWPVPASSEGCSAEFSADLTYYAAPDPEGGFNVHSTADRRVVRHFPGTQTNAPVQLKFSRGPSSFKERQPISERAPGVVGLTNQWIAAVYQDGHAEIHSLDSRQSPRHFAGHASHPIQLEFLPGTTRVLIARFEEGLAVYDLADGASRELLAPPTTLTSLAVDPRGDRLACFSDRKVKIFGLENQELLWSVAVAHGTVQLAWSPDGRCLAIAESVQPFEITVLHLGPPSEPEASSPGPIGNFNLVMPAADPASNGLSARVVAHFQDHELSAGRLAFHPDGRSLVSAGFDNRLIWRQLVQSGTRVLGQAGWHVLQFSTDGSKLAYEPSHGEIGLLEVTPSNVFHEWHRTSLPDEQAWRLAVNSDGRLLATSSARGIQLWDSSARGQIAHLPLPKQSAAVKICFDPSNDALLYSAVGMGIIRVDFKRVTDDKGDLALELGSPRSLAPNTSFLLQDFAADRRSLVVLELCDTSGASCRAWLWADAQPTRARLLADKFPLAHFALAPNSGWAVTSHGNEPDVWVWAPRSGRRLTNLGISHSADSRISPDGRWVLVTTRDAYELWEPGTWKPGTRWAHSLQRDNWVSGFSTDGSWVATSTAEGHVEIRSLPSAELILDLPSPQPLRFRDLAFSPGRDRLYLWQSTGRLLEWDLRQLRREFAARGLGWPE